MSAVRSFINGESLFSKAQKDGSRHLQLYLSNRNEVDYKLYIKNLSIEVNDSLALHSFLSSGDAAIVKNFVGGGNNVGDARDMVWLVRNFKDVSFLQHIFIYWRGANSLLRIMHIRAVSIHDQIEAGTYTIARQHIDSRDINFWDDTLTSMEQHFSDTLDEASRVIRQYLLTAEFLMIMLILGLNGVYSALTIRRLFISSKVLELKNQSLTDTNFELDRFVYSASHDLRAPLTSLQGLLKIIKDENDLNVIRKYHELMERSLQQQDDFIREIINYSRYDHTIKIRCAIEKNLLKLIVEDNGIGIQEKYKQKIFDMFFVTLHSKRGSGLGLYITRETLTKLGGTITVSSSPLGSCFSVSIPLLN